MAAVSWQAKIGQKRPPGFLTVREWGEKFGAHEGTGPWSHQRTKRFLDVHPELFERGWYAAPGADGRLLAQHCYREVAK